jgi:hypothetical protein
LRSHLFLNCYLLQACLLVNGVFTIYPAWSLPTEVVSRSAIDLVKQNPPLESNFAVEDMQSEANVMGSTTEAGVNHVRKSQESEMKNQESGQTVPVGSPDQEPLQTNPQTLNLKSSPASTLDLDPNLLESSPVLQRWLKQVPNVLTDIKRDPSFRTRLRLGYTQFPSSKQASGLNVGLEDVFVGRSGLTLSADYQTTFNGQREAWGGDLRYYIRPLGSVINIAPVLGYRHLTTTRYSTEGMNVGLRFLLVPSRTGAADLALTQSWVAPRGQDEVGLTTLSFGYALTHNLRLSTDIQKQNSRFRSDSRVGLNLEWMF